MIPMNVNFRLASFVDRYFVKKYRDYENGLYH